MTHLARRSSLPFVACSAALLLFASRVPAQSHGTDPYKTAVVTAPSPYWSYTYTPYVVRTPLDGVAEMVRAGGDYLRAEGDYLLKKQEVALRREDVRQKKLETRRKELEQWVWERDLRANEFNRERERVHNREVEYARNFPAQTEILAGTVINRLFDDLARRPDLPADGSTTIDPDWLAHVHVTVGGRANIGLLKGDKIIWPQLLLRSDFADDRDQIDQLLTRAKDLVVGGSGDQKALAPVLRELEATVRTCHDHIDEEIRRGVSDPACNPRHAIEGTRFLKQVTDAQFMLEKPDAAYYLTPLRGKTVADSVESMKKNGVRFAPATVGCERYDVALHRALAVEVTRLKNLETPSNNR